MTQLKPSLSPKIKLDKAHSIDSRICPWLARILYPIGCYLVLPYFFSKIEVFGRENIPRKDAVIIAPTHRSRWDALLIPYATGRIVSGRDLRFMVSADEVKGIQGWFIRRMGGFPIDTKRPSMGSLIHSIELLQEDEEMLVIFPEGGIFRGRTIYPLKRGVAVIALEAKLKKRKRNVKILPVSIDYSEPFPTRGSKVRVNIGEPIDVDNYLSDSLRQSSLSLTQTLKISLERLYKNAVNI